MPDPAEGGARASTRWTKVATSVASLCAIAAVAVLSLSDRAPATLERAARRLGLDGFVLHGALGIEFDTLGHAAVWATVTGAACLAVGARVTPVVVAAAAIAGSAFIEVLQATTTESRAFQLLDLVANTVGVVVAALVVVVGRVVRASVRRTAAV